MVLAVFVVVPLVVAFLISRQSGAQLLRRKAIASAHQWAVENKNEGQLVWVLRGAFRGRAFEAVQLLREGGGRAWRLRTPVRHLFRSWVLVTSSDVEWRPEDFGTISSLVVRSQLPMPADVEGQTDLRGFGEMSTLQRLGLQSLLAEFKVRQAPFALSLVDDGIVLDGRGDLPEGEALLPWLETVVRLAERIESASTVDGGTTPDHALDALR